MSVPCACVWGSFLQILHNEVITFVRCNHSFELISFICISVCTNRWNLIELREQSSFANNIRSIQSHKFAQFCIRHTCAWWVGSRTLKTKSFCPFVNRRVLTKFLFSTATEGLRCDKGRRGGGVANYLEHVDSSLNECDLIPFIICMSLELMMMMMPCEWETQAIKIAPCRVQLIIFLASLMRVRAFMSKCLREIQEKKTHNE